MTTSTMASRPRTTSRKWIGGAALAGAMALFAGCEQVTAPEEAMAQAPNASALPIRDAASPSLLRQLREAVRSGEHPEAAALLRQAQEHRGEAREAMRADDREAGRLHMEASRDATIAAVVSALGSPAVEGAIAAREERLERMHARLDQASRRPAMAERASARLAEAEARLAEAKERLAADDPHGALEALGVLRTGSRGMRGARGAPLRDRVRSGDAPPRPGRRPGRGR